ncbi:MAG TPA: hypothetical protein VN581_12480, partial [Patescibacteria group bacterium]|nr:hypothetical protein [Patescibacteria group bacterium]
ADAARICTTLPDQGFDFSIPLRRGGDQSVASLPLNARIDCVASFTMPTTSVSLNLVTTNRANDLDSILRSDRAGSLKRSTRVVPRGEGRGLAACSLTTSSRGFIVQAAATVECFG